MVEGMGQRPPSPSPGRGRHALWAGALLAAVVGCQSPRPHPDGVSPIFAPPAAADYRVVFPDILEVAVPGRPDASGQFLVMPDGNVELGGLGRVFAEGRTVFQLTQQIAAAAGVPETHIGCRVSQPRSRVVHVFGPAGTTPASLPYAGPERVADVLTRAGMPGATAEATVVRRNTATGRPEQTFRVDLTAIRAGDPQTNMVLEPNDEVRLIDPFTKSKKPIAD